ncbi:hypothetical protein [Paucihalobacter sp.]|uniref:hypothetical protein n=1 Tax=Paucihalobacter sp. TaxID=2850405 RepID=UPI002FE26DA0
MKTLILIFCTILVIPNCSAQEKNIQTHSVTLDQLIGFVVETYKTEQGNIEVPHNVVFLLQYNGQPLPAEEAVLLKQAFKILSSRLSEETLISIATYSGVNGIALQQTPSTELKKILHTIENLQSSIKEFHDDGIAMAYDYMNTHFDEDFQNSIVIIRNPNSSSTSITSNIQATKEKKSKGKPSSIVLTAIALLPEIISVIKN